MNKERQKAIDKYTNNKQLQSEFLRDAAKKIQEYPQILATDTKFRDATYKLSLSYYKLILLEKGVAYSDVYRMANDVKNSIAQRNGKKEFIERINSMWMSREAHLTTSEKQPELNSGVIPNSEYILEENREVSLA